MPPPEPFHLLFQEALKKRDLIPHSRIPNLKKRLLISPKKCSLKVFQQSHPMVTPILLIVGFTQALHIDGIVKDQTSPNPNPSNHLYRG